MQLVLNPPINAGLSATHPVTVARSLAVSPKGLRHMRDKFYDAKAVDIGDFQFADGSSMAQVYETLARDKRDWKGVGKMRKRAQISLTVHYYPKEVDEICDEMMPAFKDLLAPLLPMAREWRKEDERRLGDVRWGKLGLNSKL